jgi:hypothetical protein
VLVGGAPRKSKLTARDEKKLSPLPRRSIITAAACCAVRVVEGGRFYFSGSSPRSFVFIRAHSLVWLEVGDPADPQKPLNGRKFVKQVEASRERSEAVRVQAFVELRSDMECTNHLVKRIIER